MVRLDFIIRVAQIHGVLTNHEGYGKEGVTNPNVLLESCTGEVYWRGVLERCTGEVYWRGVLESCTGEAYWRGVLERCTGEVYCGTPAK